MLYLALASLSCALIATLAGYTAVAVVLAQVGEILFVFSALVLRDSNSRHEALAAALG